MKGTTVAQKLSEADVRNQVKQATSLVREAQRTLARLQKKTRVVLIRRDANPRASTP